MNTYKPCEFAKKLNVSVKTLQRWDNAGKSTKYQQWLAQYGASGSQ